MEWARETVKGATNAAMDPSRTANAAYNAVTNMANTAYEAAANPGKTASAAYDSISDYVPTLGGGENGENGENGTSTNYVSSIMSTAPFSSFKPDPSTVWKGHLIYVMLAAGCSISWWTFVTAADYFQYLYPGTHIIRFFTLAYFVTWLIVYAFFIRFVREGTCWVKISAGLGIGIVSIISIPFMDGVLISGDRGTDSTFWVTISAVAVAGAADAVGQGSLLGICAELPESFAQAYVSGASASGVFVFIARLITKASFDSSGSGLRTSAIIYFSVAGFFIVLVLSLFAYFHYMPEMGYYNSMNLGSFQTVRLLIQDESTVSAEVAAGAAIAAVAAGSYSPAQPLIWKPVMNRIKFLAVAVAMTSIVSLTVFPGYLTEDVHSGFFGSWYQVLLVGTYILSDFLGRKFTSYSVTQRQSTTVGASWFRLILIAFFLLALLEIGTAGPLLIFLLTALLGLSNGYLVAALTILIPRFNPPSEAEPAGILYSLIMVSSFIVGAGLSWIWVLVK